MLIPVILSGGAGKRLWPISRIYHPKPFIDLDGESLLQKALARAQALPGVQEILTVTTRDLYFKTVDAYRTVHHPAVSLGFVLEPEGRNTAPAVAAATLACAERHPDATLLFLTADHLINDMDAFAEAVREACELAARQRIVTFGLKPDRPETGYGYIEAEPDNRVRRFVEKPDLETAQRYLADRRFLWNSGMICATAGVLLQELRQYLPSVLQTVNQGLASAVRLSGAGHYQVELPSDAYKDITPISIDYALLEKTDKAAVVPCALDWTDVGSWDALAKQQAPDSNGNRVQGEVILHEVRDCYIHAENRLVAAAGIQGLIVVDTPDALLILDAAHPEFIEQIVASLTAQGHETRLYHRTVHRPWGTYTVLETGANFKIKRLRVKPGGSLSLQMHHHRSEHWIVVDGTAHVVNGDQKLVFHRNQSTYIPAGCLHRLSNQEKHDLILIEVQSGDYLEEDDIVRFDDAVPGDDAPNRSQ